MKIIAREENANWCRLLCTCFEGDHYVEMNREVYENYVDYTIGVQHNQQTLWLRIKMAINIIFKRRVYSDVTITREQILRLRDIINGWLKKDEEKKLEPLDF
jgi:hypothetical protein